MDKKVLIGIIAGIAVVAIILFFVFSGGEVETTAASQSQEAGSTLTCEAQYNVMIKDIESSNYCPGGSKCFSLPLLGNKAFTNLNIEPCYYSASKDARGKYVSLDALDSKITSFMSRCKDVYYEFTDRCSPAPQTVCVQGKCVSYFSIYGEDCSALQGDEQDNCCIKQIGSNNVVYNSRTKRCEYTAYNQ